MDVIIPLAYNTHPLAKALECDATVLYPSSVEVYGNVRGSDIFMEDYTGKLNLANAHSCYPESKRLSEALCYSYMAERSAKVKIARLSRVFSPTMLASDAKASSQLILKALAGALYTYLLYRNQSTRIPHPHIPSQLRCPQQ